MKKPMQFRSTVASTASDLKEYQPSGGALMRADIVPSAVFPDYELPDQIGTKRKLSELQGSDPMILVLSRGGF